MGTHWQKLATALTLAMVVSSAPVWAQSALPFQGQSLRVASYGGGTGKIFREAVTGPFERRTGAHIEWSEGAPLDFMAQIIGAKGGPAPYDIALLEDIEAPQAAAQGVIYKLDFNNIPNAKLLPPEALPADGYSAAWGYFRLGIAYLPDKLKAAGIAPPKNLSIIFDPRLAGHLALPDVTQSNWPNFMPTIAAFLGNPLSDPEPTINKLASIKGASLFGSSSDMEARMTSGEIWVALWIDGRVNGLKLKGTRIEFAPMGIPDGKGGTLDYTAVLGLLTVTNPNKKALAEAWIDTLLSTPVASQIAIRSTYAPSNIEAQKAVKADPKVGPMVDTDIAKQFTPDFAAWPKVQDKWIDAWGKAFRR
jgi:putative spermidine/putrescine transport system substrate-binding protein